MTSFNIVTISAWTAHALAWAAGLFFAFGPAYQGVEVSPSLPSEPAQEDTRVSATLIETNGLYVIFLLLIPVLLTAISLLGLRLPGDKQRLRKALLFVPRALLLGFCIVGVWSIGLFYVPATIALLITAIADHRRQRSGG